MLREYIYDNQFQIWYINKYLNIYNYIEILSFDDNNIKIKIPDSILSIKGKNLTITKMISDELLIKGNIINIEFKRYEK